MDAQETLRHWQAEDGRLRSRHADRPAAPCSRAGLAPLHGGRQVATAEGRLVGPDGRLYAHATTTCLIFDTPL